MNGQGQLDVTVAGTLDQPIIQENVTVQDATLQAQALPQPLTNVTGTAQFNGDRIRVEQLQANYEEGQVTAQGVLPIFASPTAAEEAATNPPTVALDDLTLNLSGIYEGGVSGNAIITGTAFAPAIGGTIQLMDGQVLLGGLSTSPTGDTAPATGTASNQTAIAALPITFDNLQLVLEDDVRVTTPPILSFTAEGDILLNGTPTNPRPEGTVRLTGGQIDLFTTQFRFSRGYEQTAVFVPSQGFDPILDIRLFALVPEITGGRLTTSPDSGEIADTPTTAGILETVRVEAIVTGPASELSQNLELTSDPARSEAEIVALIGGNFINTLEQGTTAQGLTALAGSVLLGNFQEGITALGRTLGLSEFRVTPTVVTEAASNESVLSLAIEGVVDMTDTFSVSVAGVVGVENPVRYNVIYRVSDRLRVRASTNLAGESRALIEYETRF